MSASIAARLEYLRGEIRAQCISWAEIAELESLAGHIDPGDTELLEWAGVPEDRADEHPRRPCWPNVHAVDNYLTARGILFNGMTNYYLRERYGDRLYHVMGGGWFVRPETALSGGCGSSLPAPRSAGPDQRDRARTPLAGPSQPTPDPEPWPSTADGCEASPDYELDCFSMRYRRHEHNPTCYRFTGPVTKAGAS